MALQFSFFHVHFGCVLFHKMTALKKVHAGQKVFVLPVDVVIFYILILSAFYFQVYGPAYKFLSSSSDSSRTPKKDEKKDD